jgi:methionyl-tRNA formyltransferase
MLASDHTVVALIQNGRSVKGARRRQLVRQARWLGARNSVLTIARKRSIPVVWIDKMNEEELAPLRALEPDLLLVGGFSIILKRPLLDLPRIGCVNTHSSLLPKHRGSNPFTAAILADEKESGVTFHVMEEGIDTGPILEQHRIAVSTRETAGTLYARASDTAEANLIALLDRIEADGLQGTPQDASQSSYEEKVDLEETYIDWRQPAEDIDRLARALAPFMPARLVYREKPIMIRRSEFDPKPVDTEPGTIIDVRPRVRVATGEGSLEIVSAYCLSPLPWFWPSFMNRPKPGDRVA